MKNDFFQRTLLSMIDGYQKTEKYRMQIYMAIGISPHACRHTPTCSQHARSAIKDYGTIKGTFIAVKRLLNCHPFSKNITK